MKISDIWKKIIGVFSKQKKSNIKFIDDSTESTKRYVPQTQMKYGEKPKIELIQEKKPEEVVWEWSEETWQALEEEERPYKERQERLLNNPKFMKMLDILMRHDHKAHEYYYHGTALENAEGIINEGLYLRSDSRLSVTAVREFEEKGLFAHRGLLPEEELFEMEKSLLISYSRNSGRGEECVVVIDKPQQEESIVQKVEEADAPDIASEWICDKPKGVVDPKWIVGYVDKVNGIIVANPLYYDYDRIEEQLSEVREENDLVTGAVQATVSQNKTSELNKQASTIREGQQRGEQQLENDNRDDVWI